MEGGRNYGSKWVVGVTDDKAEDELFRNLQKSSAEYGWHPHPRGTTASGSS